MARNGLAAQRDVRAPWRAGTRLPGWVLLAFLLKALAVAVLALLSYRAILERRAIAANTTRTLETLGQLESVLSTLKDAETGERGYLLTGDNRYLEPYEAANAALPAELSSLHAYTSDNAALGSELTALDRVVHEKLDHLRRTIAFRRAGKLGDMRDLLPEGRATMDAAREIVRQMKEAETARLQRGLDAQERTAGGLIYLTLLGAGVILFLIAASSYATSRAFRDREVQAWVRTGQNRLVAQFQGVQGFEKLGHKILSFLGEYLDARIGAIHAMTPDGRLMPCGAFALAAPAEETRDSAGGLVGQAARERRLLHLSDIPDGYLRVTSSVGTGDPRELVILPAVSDGATTAVIELGFFRKVGTGEMQLLESAGESIATAFRAETYRTRQAELLEESQRQGEELQTQQEELKTANEELEEQTQRLRTSQEELEETNAKLEEQTQALESQKESILTSQRLLQQKATDVERASRYKSEFLANMSHELRTPLNSSLILAKLLIDNKEGNLTDEQVRYAQSIYGAGNELLTMINDILDLAKIESGKVDVSIERVAIARIVENLRRRFDPIAAEKKVELDFRIEPGSPGTIDSDPQRLQQILTNLLSNAMKFTERGAVRVRVAPLDAKRISFSVEDTGIGIPAEQHEVIFEAFRQADGTTVRKYGGTGLGLSICRELVGLLGGTIELRSAPGQGSTFTAVLPIRSQPIAVQPREERRVQTSPPAENTSPAAPLVPDDRETIGERHRAVLIVEDDPKFAAILRDLGRELSFQCIVARDASEGLALARQYRPVAVLLDIGLPDHSGLTVLELLKRDPATRHAPIHVLSVHDYQKVARELGAAGYVLKPVKREQLVETFRLLEDRLSRKVKSVLVIEDDDVQRDAIAKLLQADDVKIVAVGEAEIGLAHLRSATFDCCVLDLWLPGMSGFDLLEGMSSDASVSFPPVIVYTARTLSQDEEQRLRRLSSSIIVKGARSPERLLEEVTLFLHQVEADLPPERQRMLRAARDRERIFEGRRVLLVEDDVRTVFALTRTLEPKGLSVEIARNGKEALARMSATPGIDLVLMDIMMPEMDGLAATREIRKDTLLSSVPIIALTAKAMPDDRQACLDAGANDYIVKPIEVERLLSLLRVWMPR